MRSRGWLVCLFLLLYANAGCAQAQVAWSRGNCIAASGPHTQLALLRAHADSATIFPFSSPTARAFGAELQRVARTTGGEALYVGPPDSDPPRGALKARWWEIGRQVHPWFRYADSTGGEFAALWRVELTPTVIGYVMQLPELDSGVSRELWMHDLARGCFLLPVQIALGWGDAGETALVESWLLDVNGDARRDLITHERTTAAADTAGAREQVADEVWVQLGTIQGFAVRTLAPPDEYAWARGAQPKGRPN